MTQKQIKKRNEIFCILYFIYVQLSVIMTLTNLNTNSQEGVVLMTEKVALITGAGQGIGEGIAKQLANDGF